MDYSSRQAGGSDCCGAAGFLVPGLMIYAASSMKEPRFGRRNGDVALVTLHLLTRCLEMGTANVLKLFGRDLQSCSALRKRGASEAMS